MNTKTAIRFYLQNMTRYLIGGVVCSLVVLWGTCLWLGFQLETLGFYEYALALAGGILAGLGAKAAMLLAIELVMRANAASAQLNAKRAKALSDRLKVESKQKIRERVTEQAIDIILQMQGEEALQELETFLHSKIEDLAEDIYFKVDRHLNYLADRAVHGDIKSLKRLYELYRKAPEERAKEIDQLLSRFMNEPSEIQKLKDKVDTLYDHWKFRFDARSYLSDEPAL